MNALVFQLERIEISIACCIVVRIPGAWSLRRCKTEIIVIPCSVLAALRHCRSNEGDYAEIRWCNNTGCAEDIVRTMPSSSSMLSSCYVTRARTKNRTCKTLFAKTGCNRKRFAHHVASSSRSCRVTITARYRRLKWKENVLVSTGTRTFDFNCSTVSRNPQFVCQEVDSKRIENEDRTE